MNRRTHMRNAAVAALAVLLIFLIATQQMPVVAAPLNMPLAQGALATLETLSPTSQTVIPGTTSGNFSFRLVNNSSQSRTFSLEVLNLPANYTVASFSTPVIVNAGSANPATITLQVSVPTNAVPGTVVTLQLRARSGAVTPDPEITLVASFQIVVGGATPTSTPSATATTGAPTATPTRGPVCRDGFEGDDGPAGAKVIDVNTSQERAICPSGDVDWLVFGGVKGKTYTVDISRMDPGIDLSLEIFDANFNSIAFNDDFYNRDPANPNAGDIRPRIQIRIPADGPYYIKVRDAAGRGGVNYIYVIALLDESYGPTPTLVREICQDLFEPDGLPEQAHLLTSNEIQEDRKLCPAGDADWVKFFGKAGKRYILYTDTRRYRGRNVVNGETQAGADTTIVLTDRDGVSMIDVNDDIAGGGTLDSQIEFVPDVDGFYFLQIKNNGDIGNQFVRYDLVLLLCVPGQTDCGRASVAGTPVAPITPPPTGTPDREFNLDPTRTLAPTATRTPVPSATTRPGP